MEELKRIILKYIEVQEVGNRITRKTARRYTLILITCACILASIGSMTLYIISRPPSATEISIKSIDDWNRIILLQKKFVQEDREDAAKARTQLQQMLDSFNLKEKEKKDKETIFKK